MEYKYSCLSLSVLAMRQISTIVILNTSMLLPQSVSENMGEMGGDEGKYKEKTERPSLHVLEKSTQEKALFVWWVVVSALKIESSVVKSKDSRSVVKRKEQIQQ